MQKHTQLRELKVFVLKRRKQTCMKRSFDSLVEIAAPLFNVRPNQNVARQRTLSFDRNQQTRKQYISREIKLWREHPVILFSKFRHNYEMALENARHQRIHANAAHSGLRRITANRQVNIVDLICAKIKTFRF